MPCRRAPSSSTARGTTPLSNGIRFMVFPCTSRSIYGFSIVGAAMDEVGRFRFEGAADTDVDVQHAIKRGMAMLYNRPPRLIKISSPSSRAGLLYTDFQRSFGKPDPHRLVWQSASEKMAAGIVDSAFIQRIREEDPLRAARIYDAEFCEDVDVFLSAEVIEAVTDYGTFERLPEEGVKYIAACDPAGHGNDAFTLSLVKVEGTTADLRIQQVFSKAWVKPRSGLRNLETCVAEASDILRRHQIKTIYGDRAMSGWVLEAFQRHGVMYDYPFIKRDGQKIYATRSDAYQESAPLFRAQRVRILDDETTRRELRNLEQRGDRVTPGPGHDDRANSLCLAIFVLQREVLPPRGWIGQRIVELHDAVEGIPRLALAFQDVHDQRDATSASQDGQHRDQDDDERTSHELPQWRWPTEAWQPVHVRRAAP